MFPLLVYIWFLDLHSIVSFRCIHLIGGAGIQRTTPAPGRENPGVAAPGSLVPSCPFRWALVGLLERSSVLTDRGSPRVNGGGKTGCQDLHGEPYSIGMKRASTQSVGRASSERHSEAHYERSR
jgi:hypothetical protein